MWARLNNKRRLSGLLAKPRGILLPYPLMSGEDGDHIDHSLDGGAYDLDEAGVS